MKYIKNIDAYECTQGKYIIRRKDLEKKERQTQENVDIFPKQNKGYINPLVAALLVLLEMLA